MSEAKELVEDWHVESAYVGIAYQDPEAKDEYDGPIWTVPIECNGGDAQLAEVCGGSKKEALARAHAVCRALVGGSLYDGEWVNQIDRLWRTDNEEDWIAAEALTHLSSTVQSLQQKSAEAATLLERQEQAAGKLRDSAVALALEAGKLNVALEGHEKFRRHRQAIVDAMNDLNSALREYREAHHGN